MKSRQSGQAWLKIARHGSGPACLLVVLLACPAAVPAQSARPVNAPADGAPAKTDEQAEAIRAFKDAMRLKSAGKTQEAIDAERRALKIVRRLLGGQQPADLIAPLVFLASCEEELSHWPEAKAARSEILERSIAAYGRDDYRVVDARGALTDVDLQSRLTAAQRAQRAETGRLGGQLMALYRQRKYGEAAPLAERVVELQKAVLGASHPQYAQTLNNLALLYDELGEYTRAEPLYQHALAIRKQALGAAHPDYATTLNNLASLYTAMGDYARAEPLLRQALAIRKQVFGETHPEYAQTLNNLAALDDSLGDYAAAERLYRQALDIHKKVFGEADPAYATSLNNLALLYQDIGDYARAEPLYQQALAIRKQVLGEGDPGYATSLHNLAFLYDAMGDYARAEPLYLQALAIRKKTLSEAHPDYARGLHNLAMLYMRMGDYARAEPLYRQVLESEKQTLGQSHPDYATSLDGLAGLYQSMGDYARAEPLYQQSFAIRKRTVGQTHYVYAQSLNNLAVLYQSQGDYARAEPLYRQAMEIDKQARGESHPGFATSVNNLAALYRSMGDYARAEPLYRQAASIALASFGRTFAGQSERQQAASVAELRNHLDSYVALVAQGHGDASQAYAIWLQWKGLVLRQQQQLHSLADRPELQPQFERLKQVTARLARLALATPPPSQQAAGRNQMADLSSEQEHIEQNLAQRSAEFRASLHRPTVDELRQALPKTGALLDFVDYRTRQDGKGQPDAKDKLYAQRKWQRRLAAFVVLPTGDIKVIDLGESASISQAIDAWRGKGDGDFGRSAEAREAGRLLRERIWQPLAAHLAGAKLVLLSPEGALGKLPFAALPGNEPDTYLLEDYALVVIPSPAALTQPRPKPTAAATGNLLVVANVDYDRLPSAAPARKESFLAQRGPARDTDDRPWQHLDGTLGELDALKLLYAKNFGRDGLKTLAGPGASEELFRQAAPHYEYLHLATHGFFAASRFHSTLTADLSERGAAGNQLVTRQNVSGYHPGLLSGLVLAGANHPQPGGDDGYLTAEEVATLDLRGVELCVLSACETGLGPVAGGEGLLGLQRAFQAAGAHAVVASLWRVPDQATRTLMERFYTNLWQHKPRMTKIEALREAQLWMLRGAQPPTPRKSTSRGLESDTDNTTDQTHLPPYYWAAFVLSGDWQ